MFPLILIGFYPVIFLSFIIGIYHSPFEIFLFLKKCILLKLKKRKKKNNLPIEFWVLPINYTYDCTLRDSNTKKALRLAQGVRK